MANHKGMGMDSNSNNSNNYNNNNNNNNNNNDSTMSSQLSSQLSPSESVISNHSVYVHSNSNNTTATTTTTTTAAATTSVNNNNNNSIQSQQTQSQTKTKAITQKTNNNQSSNNNHNNNNQTNNNSSSSSSKSNNNNNYQPPPDPTFHQVPLERLAQHQSTSRAVCEQVIEFVKLNMELSNQSASKYIKYVKPQDLFASESSGTTLEVCLQQGLKQYICNVAHTHQCYVKKLEEGISRPMEFQIHRHTEHAKQLENDLKQITKSTSLAQERLNKAKLQLAKASSEEKLCTEKLMTSVERDNPTVPVLDALKKKLHTSQQRRFQSEQYFLAMRKELHAMIARRDKFMSDASKSYQKQELQRILYLKDSLCRLMNHEKRHLEDRLQRIALFEQEMLSRISVDTDLSITTSNLKDPENTHKYSRALDILDWQWDRQTQLSKRRIPMNKSESAYYFSSNNNSMTYKDVDKENVSSLLSGLLPTIGGGGSSNHNHINHNNQSNKKRTSSSSSSNSHSNSNSTSSTFNSTSTASTSASSSRDNSLNNNNSNNNNSPLSNARNMMLNNANNIQQQQQQYKDKEEKAAEGSREEQPEHQASYYNNDNNKTNCINNVHYDNNNNSNNTEEDETIITSSDIKIEQLESNNNTTTTTATSTTTTSSSKEEEIQQNDEVQQKDNEIQQQDDESNNKNENNDHSDDEDEKLLNRLSNIIKTEDGRAYFLQALNERRGDRMDVENKFDLLAKVMNQFLDACYKDHDVRSARQVMLMANTFFRTKYKKNNLYNNNNNKDAEDSLEEKESLSSLSLSSSSSEMNNESKKSRADSSDDTANIIEKEYLQTRLKSHPIWHKRKFWMDALMLSLADQFDLCPQSDTWDELPAQQVKESVIHVHNTVFGQLGSIAFNMMECGVSEADLRQFVFRICEDTQLSEEQSIALNTTIGKYFQSKKNEEQEQSNNISSSSTDANNINHNNNTAIIS